MVAFWNSLAICNAMQILLHPHDNIACVIINGHLLHSFFLFQLSNLKQILLSRLLNCWHIYIKLDVINWHWILIFDTITVTQSHSLKVLHALNAFASCLCTLVSFGLSQATTFSWTYGCMLGQISRKRLCCFSQVISWASGNWSMNRYSRCVFCHIAVCLSIHCDGSSGLSESVVMDLV